MTILIVDDSHHVHIQMQAFLSSVGLNQLRFAVSAEEAFGILGLAGAPPPALAIDLILMDINLENLDGIEATRQIKADERFLDVPVIMVTGDTSTESLRAAFDAGAVDYITKPIRKVELVARVTSLLRLRQEIESRKAREREKEKLIAELEEALNSIKTLRGLIPICASCKKIRDDGGYWKQIESYIRDHSEAEFSHGYCPECAAKLHEEIERYRQRLADEPEDG